MGIMKSFHLFSETPMTPERCVSDYRPEELSCFQEAFRPQSEQFRRNHQTGNIVLGVAFLSALAGVVFPVTFVPWFIGGFVVGLLVFLALLILSPMPDCPACRNKLDGGFGAFCPECGARGLELGGLFRDPACSSCDRTMRRGKTRGYKIRACTFCGVMLDEEGL
jgi:hypothetical protein